MPTNPKQTTLRAYHGDPAVKTKYVWRVHAHRTADQIIQGTGWIERTKKGCAVGCTLDGYDHGRYPIELGIPLQLAYAEDHIFERLAKDRAIDWPAQFLEAIPIGADLSGAVDRAMLWTLEYDLQAPIDYPEGIGRHEALIALYNRRLTGDEPATEEWQAVEQAAWDAWDAWAAWDAWDAWAAWDARDARAAWDARAARAARDARAAWDAWDARAAFYPKLADSLLEILRTSPVPKDGEK